MTIKLGDVFKIRINGQVIYDIEKHVGIQTRENITNTSLDVNMRNLTKE